MRIVTVRTFVLVVCISLSLMYLINIYIPQRSTCISKSDRGEHRGIRKSIKNISDFVWSPCQPNSSVTSINGFKSLPPHLQDFLYYQHCRHFPMLLDVPDKCGGDEQSGEVFLLLVIKSPPQHHKRREVLRKTWAEEKFHKCVWIRRVFILGTTGVGLEKVRQNKLLEREQSENNDILQWDFADTFFNLTLKQVLFLEWLERRCPKAHFLFNGDDDIFANPNNMVEYLQGLNIDDGSKHLFSGNLMWGAPEQNPKSKYYVPVQIYEPNKYPYYLSGAGYFLSHYTATVIYNMSKSIPLIPIDDAYMGMCMAKAGLRPSRHEGVKPLMPVPPNLDNIDPCHYKEIILAHGFTPAGIVRMWHRINDPNLKCTLTSKLYKYIEAIWV